MEKELSFEEPMFMLKVYDPDRKNWNPLLINKTMLINKELLEHPDLKAALKEIEAKGIRTSVIPVYKTTPQLTK